MSKFSKNAQAKKSVIICRPLPRIPKNWEEQLFMPLGPLYLSSSLISAGYDVLITDTSNDKALKEIEAFVSQNTVCFGISSMSGPQLGNGLELAKQLRKLYPKIPLIWGGVHATALPEQTLNNDYVDYIVWGEGEDIFPELLEAIENDDILSLKGKAGIGYKIDGELFIGDNSGYTSLDKVFSLPYHLVEMDKYARKLLIGAEREFPIWTSRGCPFRCKFCSNSSDIWPNTVVRYHSLDHVIADVKTLVNDYGADMITLADQNFLLSEDNFIEMIEAIKNEGIFVKYRFAARIDLLDKLKRKTWRYLKDNNIVSIGTAPESGSQKVLDNMGKGITLEQIYRVDSLLTEYGFLKSFNFLAGTPGETREDLKLTLKLIADLAQNSLNSPYPFSTLNAYMPLPGTKFYNDAIELGFVPPSKMEDWALFDSTDIMDNHDLVRPWISEEDCDYINRCAKAVVRLDGQLKGPGTELNDIKEALNDLERLCEE